MARNAEQTRIQELLRETIMLLCRNSLNYRKGFAVEALIGVTIDDHRMFMVNVKESVLLETETSTVCASTSEPVTASRSDTASGLECTDETDLTCERLTDVKVEPDCDPGSQASPDAERIWSSTSNETVVSSPSNQSAPSVPEQRQDAPMSLAGPEPSKKRSKRNVSNVPKSRVKIDADSLTQVIDNVHNFYVYSAS